METAIGDASGEANGFGAGDTGFADFEDVGAGGNARVGHRAADQAGVEGRATGESRGVVSGAAPAGKQRVDSGGVGRVGEQPEGEVLLADAGGEEVHAGGRGELGEALGGDWNGAEGEPVLKREGPKRDGAWKAPLPPGVFSQGCHSKEVARARCARM